MSALLENLYSTAVYNKFIALLLEIVPSFAKQKFPTKALHKELEDRMKHASKVLHLFFPTDYVLTASPSKCVPPVLLYL
jgi:hypothetical protein